MQKWLAAILSFVCCLLCFSTQASHIIGGEMTYKFLGDSAGYHRYQVALVIYEDCLNGQPEAIRQDNPAFLGVYRGGPFTFVRADSVQYAQSVNVPANFTNACVSNVPKSCLVRKTFVINYAFPTNSTGYIIDNQRCCRNNAIMNIKDPGDQGSTYFCYIPPSNIPNNSAVFKNYPPQIICLNNPLVYDHSATDADGDSLSYGFAPPLLGASDADIKPFPPAPPPFDTVAYMPPFSSQVPMTGYPAIRIDPRTGTLSGTPNRLGRYLVAVYCNEYRHGVLINTITREFQFVVTDCSKVVVADIPILSTEPNTYIVDCQDYKVHFVNTSSGGFSYLWDFGLPGNHDTSALFEPTFEYPDSGTYFVKLVVNPGSTCPDSIGRLVKVYPKFRAGFIDTGGRCPGSEMSFIDMSSATIKPITNWKWLFGDGDSSLVQNPVHTFPHGGLYNVMLISQNVKACADTAIHQVYIDNYGPFAGKDTVIVKGESVRFNASGGITYRWSPPDNLDNPDVYNPTGYFPQTGTYTYYVFTTSPYGCSGYDTVVVTVVNQAAFSVPNAFTPNGDGLNDFFRPQAVGYRGINYFRIFNRWGQEVFFTTSLETGWNGTVNDHPADMGTYFWQISFTDRFGNTGAMKGDVILIR